MGAIFGVKGTPIYIYQGALTLSSMGILNNLIGKNKEQNIACFGLYALIAIAAIGTFTSPMSTQTSLMATVGLSLILISEHTRPLYI